MLAPLVLAALFAPVCHGQLVPPTPVEQAMEFRRLFGLPSQRAYVRRVQRSDARRDDRGFAFTRREWHYWHKRYRIQDSASRVDGYVDRRPGLEGGVSIEDDWPKGPYLLVRVTRDAERHQAALRRIYPYRLRTTAVQYSGVELLALQDRIADDQDALAAEGFDIFSAGADIEANRVVVQMVSARADHRRTSTRGTARASRRSPRRTTSGWTVRGSTTCGCRAQAAASCCSGPTAAARRSRPSS